MCAHAQVSIHTHTHGHTTLMTKLNPCNFVDLSLLSILGEGQTRLHILSYSLYHYSLEQWSEYYPKSAVAVNQNSETYQCLM